MSLNKITLRKSIVNNIDNATNKSNNDYYIVAAELYGIYRAIGGTKTTVLPPFCDEIKRFSYNLAKAKIKFDKAIKHKNIGCNEILEILSDIDEITNIRCKESTDKIVIILVILNKETIIIFNKHKIYYIFYELLKLYINYTYKRDINLIDNSIETIFTSNWEGDTYG